MSAASPTHGIDIAAVRVDTPATENLIHFNNAGAALAPTTVVDAVVDHLRLESELGGYEAQDAAADRRADTYLALAELLNCRPTELAMATGASEAWWRTFQAVRLQPGDRVLAGRAAYNANAFALIQAGRRGIDVEIVDDDADGQIDLEAMEATLDERVKLVALTHVPTSGGLVNPAAEVGALAKENGSLYLLDACQSAGQRVLDVEVMQCDMLVLTGRKYLRGPRGTGALYVRAGAMDQLEDPTFIDSHSADWVTEDSYELRRDATRFELFESSVASQIGLGVAVRYALSLGLEAIEARVSALADGLRTRLELVPGATVLDKGVDRCGIVAFTVDGHDGAALVSALRAQRINTSLAWARTAQLDLGARGIDTAIRASVHYYNTDAEQDRFIEVLECALRTL